MSRRTIISITLTLFFISAIFIFLWVVFNAGPVATGKYLVAQVGSAIGVTVSIPPNPFNMLALQLQEKEFLLTEKEKELQQKEIALGEKAKERENKTLLYLFLIGGVLFALVVANFYFDWRRRKKK